MQLKVLTLLAALFCASVSFAQCTGSPNCTVKAAGGGGYTTIQACATAMANGDTCTVFAGTYNENVTVGAGGVASYKTLTVNPGDTVNVFSFTINSHNKLNGFTIKNPSSPNSAPCVSGTNNMTDYFITNNTMTACAQFIVTGPNGSNSSNGFIQGNTMSYSCSTSIAPNTCTAMQIRGNNILVENNDISHVSDGAYFSGSHIVYRKNTFHDIVPNDCGSNSSNGHVDFMQADANVAGGALGAQFLLIEGNTINSMVGGVGTTCASTDTHAMGLFQAEVCNGQCNNAIVRFNVASHVGGGGIIDDNSGATPGAPNTPAWINVKSYNNSWIDVGNQTTSAGNGTNGYSHGSTGGAEINDLFYYPFALVDFNPYYVQDTALASFVAKNNLGFCTTSPCLLRPKNYGTGAFTDDPGNIKIDPLFINYSGNNFNLSALSPAIGAGTSLTTVSSGCSGSTTSLTVGDASLFQGGYGIAGVQDDKIRVGALITSPVVQISTINYSTNVITLATAISCSNGAPVFLAYDSSGKQQLFAALPDIGGLQSQIIPPAPTPAIFAAVPLPAGPLAITNVSISPTKSYVSAQGCSQDGLIWNVNCPVKLFCTGCSNSTLVTFDGKSVTGAFKTGEIDVNIPLLLLPIPTVATNHTFALSNPVITVPVLQ